MKKINKIDFYCGAFLSFLVSNGVEPTLFEVGDKSRILEFLLKQTKYKAFLKYSAKKRSAVKQGKTVYRWDIGFSQKECEMLEQFDDPNRNVVIVCVCTDPDMKETDFAVLSYEDARKCMGLGEDRTNEQRRISVQYVKGSSKLRCYGTGLSSDNAVETPHNYEKVFGLTSEEEE